MATPTLQSWVEGSIFHVTLNRPEKRNALTFEMVIELGEVVSRIDEQPDVRAVILSGAGPVFSSGIDVPALAASRENAGRQNAGRWLRRLADRMQYALHLIEATELPIIAAIQGQAIGMGLELALACDLRVITQDCLLSIPESRMGLVADVGGTTRLTRLLGPSRAKDLLMTGRTVDADEALCWGLANRVATSETLMQTAISLAESIAQNAPLAVGMAKRIVDQGIGLSSHDQMAIERWAQSQLIDSDDVTEAAKAFLEKRPPQFRGT